MSEQMMEPEGTDDVDGNMMAQDDDVEGHMMAAADDDDVEGHMMGGGGVSTF